GTNNSADCDFGMDIIADNNTGMVIKKGTLNNPTDYAVSNLADGSDGPTYFAPNGKEHVTRTRVSGQPWEPLSVNVDNSSYAGLYVYTNDNVQIDINLANADAAMSKVAIPLPPPTNLREETTPANTQQVELTWTVSPETTLSFNHVIYWKKDGCGFNCVTIDPDNNTTYHGKITVDNETSHYIHGGLDANSYYHYVIRAETSVGGVSTIEPLPPTNAISDQTLAFPTDTLNDDNDPSLLVYYDFNDNGTAGSELMNKSTNSVGSYHLTAVGSEIITAQSQFTRTSGSPDTAFYFDAAGGYAYSDDVNQDNITELSNTGNFTIAAWIYPDADMSINASIMSTADITNKTLGGFQMSQIESGGIGIRAQNKDLELEGTVLINNTWYHVVFTKEQNGVDNGTGTFYVNGVQADNETNFKTGFLKLKVGINRVTQNNWKGYIDEFKIYKRALDSADVCDLFKNDGPLNDGATCP
ncbi:MAG: hypothetical protein O2900_05430, partial [Proteobacteria bacterium]|nr:hypothetical protein [Pseudomonadota bacterium]